MSDRIVGAMSMLRASAEKEAGWEVGSTGEQEPACDVAPGAPKRHRTNAAEGGVHHVSRFRAPEHHHVRIRELRVAILG